MDNLTNKTEIENLSRLLLNENEDNLSIALKFLETNREYIPTVLKELVLCTFFANSPALRNEGRQLIWDMYGAEAFNGYRAKFEILPEIEDLNVIDDEVTADMMVHEAVMFEYGPMIIRNSNYVRLYFEVGKSLQYSFQSNTDFCIKCYEICLLADPNNAEVLFNLGHIYKKIDISKSLEYYQHCVAADPLNAGAYYNMASIYASQGLVEKADVYYNSALEAEPDEFFFRINIAGIKMHKKSFIEAEPIIEGLFADFPDHAGVLDLYSSLLWEYKKDYRKAEEIYKKALEKYPDNDNLQGNFGEMLMEINRDEEALKWLSIASDEDSSAHRLCTIIVCLALKLIRPEDALKYYRQLIVEEGSDFKKPDTLSMNQWTDFLKAQQIILLLN
jgi:tetratricopeptide (TPR) repeat protein